MGLSVAGYMQEIIFKKSLLQPSKQKMICENEKCEKRFNEIEEQLHRGDKKFVELAIRLEDLVGAQKTLTKALWGLASAIIVTLVGFVLGKI